MRDNMGFIFCIIANLSALATIAWLGFLLTRGASLWLIVVMLLLTIHFAIPASDIFTCPKCGYIEKVKVFKTHMTTVRQGDDG